MRNLFVVIETEFSKGDLSVVNTGSYQSREDALERLHMLYRDNVVLGDTDMWRRTDFNEKEGFAVADSHDGVFLRWDIVEADGRNIDDDLQTWWAHVNQCIVKPLAWKWVSLTGPSGRFMDTGYLTDGKRKLPYVLEEKKDGVSVTVYSRKKGRRIVNCPFCEATEADMILTLEKYGPEGLRFFRPDKEWIKAFNRDWGIIV